jgi:hypothetical protein
MRPWTRLALLKELALGQQSQTSLAEKYGVSDAAISQFKSKHAEEIQDIIDNAEDEFSGILLSRKKNRLATYAELLENALDDGDGKLAKGILKNMAEELGQLPNRITVQSIDTRTRYEVEGVDPEDLT